MKKGYCFLCKAWGWIEEHHIFGGANRKKSEKYGLKVGLCPNCHREGSDAAHRSGETAQKLHEYGQKKYMNEQGASIDEFRAMFGKNYLEVPMKYKVSGKTMVDVYIEVEAESPDDALDVAIEKLDRLTAFFGNGFTGKLIGVYQSDASVDASDSIEWKSAEVV